MGKRKGMFWASMIIIVLVAAGFFLNSGSGIENSVTGSVVNSNDVQVVKIHVEGGEYILEPNNVKKGMPVRLEADMSKMPGCSRSIISSELGIRKTFSSSDNTIEFTPNKAGTFYIACSMNMYRGELIVLESDGTKSNYAQVPDTSGSTCGASGGGCGCGG